VLHFLKSSSWTVQLDAVDDDQMTRLQSKRKCLLLILSYVCQISSLLQNVLSMSITFIIITIINVVSCHRPFLPGTSLEPAVIPTAQASSFTLQYSPYYV
jgi:hypothetical protein